jgi:hypothetical protein
MDIDKLLDELLADVNLGSDLDRRKAYIRCIEYADQHVGFDDYNLFLAKAADRLGQTRLLRDMLATQIKTNGRERVHIRFDDEEGCQIIVNKEGALYLTRAFRALSMTRMVGDHIHLYYGEPPLAGDSYPAILYLEDDKYFDNTDEEEGVGSLVEWPIIRREIDPNNIAGFYVSDYLPEKLFMSVNKVYPVLQWSWLTSEMSTWKKCIREEIDRMVVVSFLRDDGMLQEIALDLDDDLVGFVTYDDIRKLLWKGR